MFGFFFHQLVFSQNTVCFTIEANINNGLAFSGFTKFVNVLDCFEVYAEPTISDSKVLHAAAVAAELLDNDEDGIVDDINLKNELSSSGALIPIFSFDGSCRESSSSWIVGFSAVLHTSATSSAFWTLKPALLPTCLKKSQDVWTSTSQCRVKIVRTSSSSSISSHRMLDLPFATCAAFACW